jgi:hypothetical protein
MKINCPCKSEISESDVLFATWEKYLLNLQFFRPRRNRLSWYGCILLTMTQVTSFNGKLVF